MTRIYKTPFAATGDREPLETADQPDGKVSLQAGWTPDYELPNDNANYRPVGRKEMNGILNEVTASLGDLQLHGFATWQAIDSGWPQGALVLHNTIVYQSQIRDNTDIPGEGSVKWVALSQIGDRRYVKLDQVGAANGVAPLGANSKVPNANLPPVAAQNVQGLGDVINQTIAGPVNSLQEQINQRATVDTANNLQNQINQRATVDTTNNLQSQINGKAPAGDQTQWNSEVREFGQIDVNNSGDLVDCPAPWVMVGLRNTGYQFVMVRGIKLRNS